MEERGGIFLKLKKILFFLISYIYIFISVNLVLAHEIVHLDRAKIRLSILPGEKKTGQITITNPSNQTKEIRVYLEDWYYLSPFDGSKEFKPAGTLPNSCSVWISFSPSEFEILPFGRQILNYIVSVPEDIEGGYYSVLFFEELLGKPEVEEGISVGVAVRIGALFYIEPEGKVLRKTKLENVSIDREGSSLEIKADLINTGNADITAKGNFHIIDRKGMVYARGKFNDVYTFPKDKAKISSKSTAKLKEGIYNLIITLQFEERGTEVLEAEINVDSKGKITKILTMP